MSDQDTRGRFVPGNKAQRKVKAKVKGVSAAARKHGRRMLKILVDLAENSPDARVRYQSASELLRRGYGAVAQAREVGTVEPVAFDPMWQALDPPARPGVIILPAERDELSPDLSKLTNEQLAALTVLRDAMKGGNDLSKLSLEELETLRRKASGEAADVSEPRAEPLSQESAPAPIAPSAPAPEAPASSEAPAPPPEQPRPVEPLRIVRLCDVLNVPAPEGETP